MTFTQLTARLEFFLLGWLLVLGKRIGSLQILLGLNDWK